MIIFDPDSSSDATPNYCGHFYAWDRADAELTRLEVRLQGEPMTEWSDADLGRHLKTIDDIGTSASALWETTPGDATWQSVERACGGRTSTPPVTAPPPSPTTTTEWTVEQRRALRELSYSMHGANPAPAVTISKIWAPPDAAPRARKWCDEWLPRFGNLGDYLLQIAEQGHP